MKTITGPLFLFVACALMTIGTARAFPEMQRDEKPDARLPKDHPPIDGIAGHSDASKTVDALRAQLAERVVVRAQVNRPDGSGASALAVSIVVSVQGIPVHRAKATTNERGEARVDGVPAGEGATVTATAAWSGVNYTATAQVAKGATEAFARLELADTTEDAREIRIGRAHLILEPSAQSVRVSEVLVLHNAGKKTYTGKPLRIALFAGARDLKGGGSLAPSLRLSGRNLEVATYLRPGETQIHFDYTLPPHLRFERRSDLAIEKVFVVLTQPAWGLEGASIPRVREMSRNNLRFKMGEGPSVPAGGNLSFVLLPPRGGDAQASPGGGREGAPSAGASAGRGEAGPTPGNAPKGATPQLVRDWRVVVKWLLPLVALFVFLGVVYWASGRERQTPTTRLDEGALSRERDALLAELAELQRRVATGDKAAVRRDAALRSELARTYRALDALATSGVRPARGASDAGPAAAQ